MIRRNCTLPRPKAVAGKFRMILGSTTVGLGVTVGVLGLLLSGPALSCESSPCHEQRAKGNPTTDVIGLVLVGLGLVTAAYGIIKVAAPTDI